MQIHMIRSASGGGKVYSKGKTYDVDDKVGQSFIEARYAREVKPTTKSSKAKKA